MPLKPVRKIKPGNRSITGKYSSQKTNSTHYFESTLERDYITLLEFDCAVESYVAQPLVLNYPFGGKIRRYTPDMLVYFKQGLNKVPLLCEVKYEEELQRKRNELQPKFDAATEYANQNGYQFKVITEIEIRTDYLTNVKFLSCYCQNPIDNNYATIVLAELNRVECITPQQLVNRLTEKGHEAAKGLYTLWQMAAGKILSFDMREKISMTTRLWINQN